MIRIIIVFFFLQMTLFAQNPAYETFLYNNYKLGQRAGNIPGGEFENPRSLNKTISVELAPVNFAGNKSTERLQNIVPNNLINTDKFAIEFWVLNHVDQPVGASAFIRDSKDGNSVPVTFGFYDKEFILNIESDDGVYTKILNMDSLAKAVGIGDRSRDFSYKSWNYQFVMTYDNGKCEIFINKHKVFSENNIPLPVKTSVQQIELAAYLENEPFMDLSNLVRYFAYYDEIPDENAGNSKYELFTDMIDRGILHPNKFHFNAGPYLTYATQNSVNILWETDRPADFMIEYGTQLPLNQSKRISNLKIEQNDSSNEEKLINEITLDGLEPATKYFYNIKAKSETGETIESGILTFGTAVQEESPFSFVVIGDTEARAHINDQLAKLIWGERPNFMLIAGDLTDGGWQSNKYEWNYEYFQGMNQIISRIPVYPILGNGEGDVYWYDRYQSLPGTGELYSFKYGNSEHFMLNSNKKELFAEGERYYNWLDSALGKSTAKWKFVTFHHAPFSSDEDDYGNTWERNSTNGDLKIRKITPLFDKHNVDMVFYGHLHSYERSFPIKNNKIDDDGTYYILAGGAGGNLENFNPVKTWFNQKAYRGHHYVKIDINDDLLEYFMYDINGSLLDTFVIEKEEL